MSILNGRHERGDFLIDNALADTYSAGNPTGNVIIPMIGYREISLVEDFNSDGVATLVATLGLEVSNDYEWAQPGKVVHWDPITDPAIVAWLTTDASASPPGGKPNGILGTGSITIPLNFSAVRFTVTRTAGTGLYHCSVRLQGTGRR